MRYSRQNKIIELITNNEIDTQEKLVTMLRECGYEVTQDFQRYQGTSACKDPFVFGQIQILGSQIAGSSCLGSFCQNIPRNHYFH